MEDNKRMEVWKILERGEGDVLYVLCLATLMAGGEVSEDASIEDAKLYWKFDLDGSCSHCPMVSQCLAIEISK